MGGELVYCIGQHQTARRLHSSPDFTSDARNQNETHAHLIEGKGIHPPQDNQPVIMTPVPEALMATTSHAEHWAKQRGTWAIIGRVLFQVR